MANPRHKTSKMKQRSRCAHHALTAPCRSLCPRCHAEKLPHCVCDNCGYYKGELKIAIKGF